MQVHVNTDMDKKKFATNIENSSLNSETTVMSRWISEDVSQVYTSRILTEGSSRMSGRLKINATGGLGGRLSRSSSKSTSTLSRVSIIDRSRAATQEIENKFPDEIFVSHLTEVFYYPFKVFWQVMISLIVMLMAELIIYNVIYSNKTTAINNVHRSDDMYILLFTLSIIYLLDVMLSMIHRLWPEFGYKMHYKVRTSSWLLCDCIVLLPLFLNSYIFFGYKYILHLVQFIAFYRIYFYFGESVNLKYCKLLFDVYCN